MNSLFAKISTIVAMTLVSLVSFAHEGMHAAGQAHVGESHMGLMEVALSVIALIAFGVWALKEAKSKK